MGSVCLLLKGCGLLQDVRDGAAATKTFHKVMQSLVDTMRAETPDPSSIAAHLLDIKDPSTGDFQWSLGDWPRAVYHAPGNNWSSCGQFQLLQMVSHSSSVVLVLHAGTTVRVVAAAPVCAQIASCARQLAADSICSRCA